MSLYGNSLNPSLHRVFRFIIRIAQFRMASTLNQTLDGLDKTQVKFMKEGCILVDESDNVRGSASKLDCHLISKGPPLHRAFSVFLFNENNELLMQRRSNMKITFPGFYTNTCCSHPLSNNLELEDKDALGVKRAAQRKMTHELGVTPEQFPIEKINYITRIHYKASFNEIFGEHEIDYILIFKGNVDVNINENEVSEVKYVSRNGIKKFVDDCNENNIPLTPWFKLILDSLLCTWWDNVDNLEKCFNHKEVIRTQTR